MLFLFFSQCKQKTTLERGETGVYGFCMSATFVRAVSCSQSCRQGLGRLLQDFTADCWWEDVSVCEEQNILFLPGVLLRLLFSFIIKRMQFSSFTFLSLAVMKVSYKNGFLSSRCVSVRKIIRSDHRAKRGWTVLRVPRAQRHISCTDSGRKPGQPAPPTHQSRRSAPITSLQPLTTAAPPSTPTSTTVTGGCEAFGRTPVCVTFQTIFHHLHIYFPV